MWRIRYDNQFHQSATSSYTSMNGTRVPVVVRMVPAIGTSFHKQCINSINQVRLCDVYAFDVLQACFSVLFQRNIYENIVNLKLLHSI